MLRLPEVRLHLQLPLQDVRDEARRDGEAGIQELQDGQRQGEDRGEGPTLMPGKIANLALYLLVGLNTRSTLAHATSSTTFMLP